MSLTARLAGVAGAMSFAHLAGFGSAKGARARADDPDDKKKPEGAEDDTDDTKAAAPAEDDENCAEDDDDTMAAAEDPEDGDGEDDDDEDDGEDKKAKKASAARRRPSADFRKGRKAERRRIAAILGAPAAGKNPALAAQLACSTGMSAAAAIGVLKASPALATGGHAERQARNPALGPDGGRSPGAAKASEGAWAEAHRRANPKAAATTGWDAAHAAAQR